MDANKDNWKAVASLSATLNRIHIRRAKLLGLDAPQDLDLSGIYRRGGDEMSAERIERQAVLEAFPKIKQASLSTIEATEKMVLIWH
jgi:hypothetical protein